MEVIPLDLKRKNNHEIRNSLAPKQTKDENARIYVVGTPGSGKTTAVISLVLDHMKCDFLFVCAETINVADAYKEMKRIIEEREEYNEELIKKEEQEKNIKIPRSIHHYWWETLEDAIPPHEMNGNAYNVIIFDDFNAASPTQKKIVEKHFANGRQAMSSPIALIQDFKAMKPVIRNCASHLMLYRGIPDEHLRDICKTYGGGMDKKEFIDLYHACTGIEFGFMYIDRYAPNVHERIRFKFDCLYDPSKYTPSRRR